MLHLASASYAAQSTEASEAVHLSSTSFHVKHLCLFIGHSPLQALVSQLAHFASLTQVPHPKFTPSASTTAP